MSDVVVQFSCKIRALCPICVGRRMLAQAAHLVDAVVSAVLLRHSGLSLDFGLSLLAATNPRVLGAIARINYEVTASHFQRRAAESGTVGKTHGGALRYRFGQSLSLHLHVHVSVFVERDNEAYHLSPSDPWAKTT